MQLKYGKVKFGYKDSWSAEPVLSDIIADWLTNFRNVLLDKQNCDYVGCPQMVLDKIFPDRGRDTYSDEEVHQGLLEWIDMLDIMIYAFRNEEPDHAFKWIEGPDHGKESERGYIIWNMISDDEASYNEWKELCEQHRDKVELGRKLFAEYYDNLWW